MDIVAVSLIVRVGVGEAGVISCVDHRVVFGLDSTKHDGLANAPRV